MIDITAAVQYEPGQVPQIREGKLQAPADDEVLVKIVASGICHTDHSAPGVLTALPIIPGHEGAGVVVSVGPEVTAVAPGDHVLMSFGSCGHCARCADDHPHDCDSWPLLNFGGVRRNGEPGAEFDGEPVFSAFFGQSSFATHTVTGERNLVRVDPEHPLELYAPLGCGFITGAGAVMNVLQPRAGESIVIFGAGPVGLAAVMGAVVVGCDPIVVVDINPQRLKLASELGATHSINPTETSTVEAIRELCPGGADYSLETAGVVDTFTAAIDAIRAGGTCGMVTVPNDSQPFLFSPLPLLFGKTLKGIIEGGSDPQVFIPRLIELHQQGRFPLEKLIQFYDFDQFEEAMQASGSGDVIKAVLRMNRADAGVGNV